MRKCAIGVIGLAVVAVLAAGCSDKSGNLSSPDPRERSRAIQAAASAAGDKAVEQIAPLVRHEDSQTASEAVMALGRMASPRACETLRQVMTTETRPAIRQTALTSLAQRAEPEAIEAIREALVRDPVPEVRGDAAVALARAGTINDVPVLAAAAGRETDPRATQSQVLAMEYLVGVRFPPPDPKMTPEQRREQLQRIRTTAMRLAEARKNKLPRGGVCKDTPR
jgi:HEAT repeat protein